MPEHSDTMTASATRASDASNQTGPAEVRFDAYGAPDVLRIVHLPAPPEPGPEQVRIRVEASSVCFTDTLIRRGLYPDLWGTKPPLVPGYDLVGRVDAVGPGVALAKGARVADLSVLGGNAQYAVRPAAGLTPVPDGLDAAEAVSLVLSWMTAQLVLREVAGVKAGQRVLVIGGNGAVGAAVIALGRLAGAEVLATASDRHHDRLRAAGATPLSRDGWQEAVRAAGGVDVAIDGVGQHAFRDTYRAIKKGGLLVMIGFSHYAARAAAYGPMFAIGLGFLRNLWPDGRRTTLFSIGAFKRKDPSAFCRALTTLFEHLAAGRIEVDVAERLTLDQVAEGHARLEAGDLRGKLVVEPWR